MRHRNVNSDLLASLTIKARAGSLLPEQFEASIEFTYQW